MFINIASVSLLLLSYLTLTSAAPAPRGGNKYTWGGNSNHGGSRAQHHAASSSGGSSFNLSIGSPNITNSAPPLIAVEQQAHGILPSGPPPASVSTETLTSLQLIAFNELFEVAFFADLIYNITNNVPGYSITGNNDKQFVLNALAAVHAQEELHALNANNALSHFGVSPIRACQYTFPVSTLSDAIALASTFTDLVLGTLQEVQYKLAMDGDTGLVRAIGSVIGQEGEQNGYYRTLLDMIPSALPFLTTSTREFAFSALVQNFVIDYSCPDIDEMDLSIFEPLTVVTSNIQPKTQNLQFQYMTNSSSSTSNFANLSLVYINQQNLPIVEPLLNLTQCGNTVSLSALFPYHQFEMNGLTIAAIVQGSGPFTDADAVTQATLFGPGLIEIN